MHPWPPAAEGPPLEDWTAPDGAHLPVQRWPSAIRPARALVLCIHGLSGASEDFHPAAKMLSGSGFATVALNLRGQGHDPDPTRRGHFLDLAAWQADLAALAREERREDPGLPLVLFGESMGGMIALQTAAASPPGLETDALILGAPVVALRHRVPLPLVTLLQQAARVAPRFRLSALRFVHGKAGLPRLTRDELWLDYLSRAPNRLRGFTLHFLGRLHHLIQGCRPAACRIHCPVLMLHGGCDVFIRGEQSAEFFRSLASSDKTERFYPGGHHLLWHDHESEQVLADLQSWMEPRFPERG